MTALPLSATSCECGTAGCDSFNCCEPSAYAEKPCVIKPYFTEVCVDYDGEEYQDEEFIDAILVDANCGKAIITDKCKPMHVKVKIN